MHECKFFLFKSNYIKNTKPFKNPEFHQVIIDVSSNQYLSDHRVKTFKCYKHLWWTEFLHKPLHGRNRKCKDQCDILK